MSTVIEETDSSEITFTLPDPLVEMLDKLSTTGLYSKLTPCGACSESVGQCEQCDGDGELFETSVGIVAEELVRRSLIDMLGRGAYERLCASVQT